MLKWWLDSAGGFHLKTSAERATREGEEDSEAKNTSSESLKSAYVETLYFVLRASLQFCNL